MTENLASLLSCLGLRESEAIVYLTCLRQTIGLRVNDITRATGLKRSTIDLILERLRDQGYVTVHYEGARRVFCAEPPEKLLFRLQKTTEDFRALMPNLALLSGNSLGNRVRFFQGRKGIEEIFDDMLLTCRIQPAGKRIIHTMTSGSAFLKALPDHEKRFIKRRVTSRIPLQWIGPDDKGAKKFRTVAANQLREMRCFDASQFPFSIELDVYADKTAILTFEKPDVLGVIIENASIAASLRSLYKLIWNSLPPY